MHIIFALNIHFLIHNHRKYTSTKTRKSIFFVLNLRKNKNKIYSVTRKGEIGRIGQFSHTLFDRSSLFTPFPRFPPPSLPPSLSIFFDLKIWWCSLHSCRSSEDDHNSVSDRLNHLLQLRIVVCFRPVSWFLQEIRRLVAPYQPPGPFSLLFVFFPRFEDFI